MSNLNGNPMFPCPVCADPREVRQTKKRKPYIVCDPCGVQVFVRGPAGIEGLERLIDEAEGQNLWSRVSEMEVRYRLRCPECGCRFWIEPGLVRTSAFDGSLKGFRCPTKNCGEVVPWKSKE